MRGKSAGIRLGLLCVLAMVATIAPGKAQDQPTPKTGGAQGPASTNCPAATTNVLGASIAQATGESLQRKRWQPQGGVVQFTIRSFATIPQDASFYVCFRWKTTEPDDKANYKQVRPERLDRNNDGTTWTITTTIPNDFPDLTPGKIADRALPLVPLADVRIVAVRADKTVAADVVATIGITHPAVAIFFALATIAIALVVLVIIANYRLEHTGIKNSLWALRIISTPSAYASLSQLQIVLWTLVVAASAVYVMSLSGDLIEITNGTLVLLGIAGAAALGSKVHSESQIAGAKATADTAKKDAAQAAIAAANLPASATQVEKDIAKQTKTETQQKADSADKRSKELIKPPDDKKPKWSDLIVNEYTHVDGSVSREIDVARFQMLLFTLITATFVLMNVLTTYVIPEIPTGFLTLMGISNGVYMGAKVAQGSG